MELKFLHMSDSHLGFSLPSSRHRNMFFIKRRGQNLVNNFKKALNIAKSENVSFIIHTGDLFNKRYPHIYLEQNILYQIRKIATDIPMYIVPGNHENPDFLVELESIPGIHIFSKAKSFVQPVKNAQVVISGFPYTSFVRDIADQLIEKTNWNKIPSKTHILCFHQMIEDALTGSKNFRLNKNNPHVIKRSSIPKEIDYIAAGHLHRYQVLKTNSKQKIIYSGSTSRIHYSERNENKGVIIARIEDDGSVTHRFEPLPVKEFPRVDLDISYFSPSTIRTKIEEELTRLTALSLAEDCFPTLNIVGKIEKAIWKAIDISSIKKYIPNSKWLVRLKTKNLKINSKKSSQQEEPEE